MENTTTNKTNVKCFFNYLMLIFTNNLSNIKNYIKIINNK